MGSLDDLKGKVARNLEKLSERYSTFWRDVKSWQSNGVTKLLSTPPGRSLDLAARTIGKSAHNLKAKSSTAIQSSVSGVVEEFKTLRRNVERNVQALTSNSGTTYSQTTSGSAAPPLLFPTSKQDISRFKGSTNAIPFPASSPAEAVFEEYPHPYLTSSSAAVNSIPSTAPSTSFPSEEASQEDPHPDLSASATSNSIRSTASSNSSLSEQVSEEDPHPDLTSASATSVFSIGYLGPPLMGPLESEGFGFSNDEVPKIGEDIAQGEASGPIPVLRLEDVRRSIGKALVVYKRIRRLGFRQSSWENKMPWHNPRPPSLAKGLKWPQQKFSSVRERHEYHRRARRRGRYLIGPTPGWSWFAADIILLAFLVNNPAGNFLL